MLLFKLTQATVYHCMALSNPLLFIFFQASLLIFSLYFYTNTLQYLPYCFVPELYRAF